MFVRRNNRFSINVLMVCMVIGSGWVFGDGGTAGWKLNHDLGGWDVLDYTISDDGRWVAFRTFDGGSGLDALYSVPTDASEVPYRIAAENGASLDLHEYVISPDSQRVVFSGDLELDGVVELFSRAIDLGGERIKLNHYLGGWSVLDFAVSGNGAWVVYRADDFGGRSALYAVPAGGGAQPVTLAAPVGAGTDVVNFAVGPDSSFVIVHGDLDCNGVDELYRAPITGSSPPQKLNHDLGGWSVLDFAVSNNGAWVVYRADDVGGRTALYSVRADGSGDPMTLHMPAVAGGVYDFTLTANSQRVIYRGNLVNAAEIELFSTRVNGSTAPVKLNHDLGGWDVLDFAVSPNSAWVVFRADDVGSGLEALYGVPANGSLSPVTLGHQTGGAPFGIHEYVMSPDSTRVVWRGDLETDGVDELFSRRVDGSGMPVKLSHDLGGWSVLEYEMSPDGGWTVYRADDYGGRVALYCARLDRSGSAVTLEAPTSAPGDVLDFSIAPDGSRVVYLGDLQTSDVNELFATDLVLFGDGFESGDPSAWSSSTP